MKTARTLSVWTSSMVLTLSALAIMPLDAQAWPFKKSNGASPGAVKNGAVVSGPVDTAKSAAPTQTIAQPQTSMHSVDPLYASGPSVGKYYISGASSRVNHFIMIKKGGNYEFFNPNGMSLGSGNYSYEPASGSVIWQGGPMNTMEFSGDQRYGSLDGGASESIRIQPQAFATFVH